MKVVAFSKFFQHIGHLRRKLFLPKVLGELRHAAGKNFKTSFFIFKLSCRKFYMHCKARCQQYNNFAAPFINPEKKNLLGIALLFFSNKNISKKSSSNWICLFELS